MKIYDESTQGKPTRIELDKEELLQAFMMWFRTMGITYNGGPMTMQAVSGGIQIEGDLTCPGTPVGDTSGIPRRESLPEYSGEHPVMHEGLIREIVKDTYGLDVEDIYVTPFFGDTFYDIRTTGHMVVLKGWYTPHDSRLLIRDSKDDEGAYPYLQPRHAEHSEAVIQDDDGEFSFYLGNQTKGGGPDWHIGGMWEEFDAVFDEGCENNFNPRDHDMSLDGMKDILRGLGFTEIQEVEA